MAHELEFDVNGNAMMAWAGEKPWHGLGKEVPNDLSPEQMLVTAGLDWTVDKIPAYADINGIRTRLNTNALVRSSDNKVLDMVSNDWNPVQNHEAFEFFNDFVGAGDMEMHTAGSLKGGQIVFALAKIKDSFELFGGDKVDGYLLFTNPHKFGQSIDVRFTPIRVVCNNTLTLAINSRADNVVKVNHRKQFEGDAVKATLGIAADKLAHYKEMAAFLGTKRYTQENLKEYFNRIFPVIAMDKEKGPQRKELSKSASRALQIIDLQPGAGFAQGSWWQAFNAVTFMTDHEIGRNADTRLTSAWFGPNRSLKLKALETAVEYAEAA
jgi:phage/plasmid-like protein (TIGR03299 family)